MTRPVDLTDYVLVSELARSRNVTRKAIFDWLERRDLKRRPYTFVLKKRGYVRADIAAEYAENRLEKRPKGWVTVKSLLAEIGYPHAHLPLLDTLKAEGRITVGIFRKVAYLPPEDAALVAQLYRSQTPLPGWVPLQAAAREARVGATALSKWAKRNGVELRYYRHPTNMHLVHFLEHKHAQRYLAKNEPRRLNAREPLQEAA